MSRSLVLVVICSFLVSPAFGADKNAVKAADALGAQAQRLEHKAKQRSTTAEEAKKLIAEAKSLRDQAAQKRAGASAADVTARQERMNGNRAAQQERAAQLMQERLERQQLLNPPVPAPGAGVPMSDVGIYQIPGRTPSGVAYYPVQRMPYGYNRGGINGFTQNVYDVRRAVNSFRNLGNTFRSFSGWFR